MTADPEFDRERFPARGPASSPPAFNVPAIVLASILILGLIHLARTQLLSDEGDLRLLLNLSFVSACYHDSLDICGVRAAGANLWSPLSHALLHGDWTHFFANALWLLAFGTPVARRIGGVRFLLFCACGALAGAGLFFLFNLDLYAPMIGASGVVSALMGGAARFALGLMGRLTSRDVASAPRFGIVRALRDRTTVFFVAIFFLTNIAVGSGIGGAFGGVEIAWEAHLGGFIFGFLCFAIFDPRRPGRPIPFDPVR